MVQRAARIVRDEDNLGGEPRIEGRRLTGLRLQKPVDERGLPPAEVVHPGDLGVADVCSALTCDHEYPDEMATVSHEHPDEMAMVRVQRRTHEQEAREFDAPTVGELAADRDAQR